MEWLAENWFWVLIGVVFVGMHVFGHGCHGGKKNADKPGTGGLDSNKHSGHHG